MRPAFISQGEGMPVFSKIHNLGKDNERKSSQYGTPLSFFKTLDSIFHFELDPCAFSGDEGGSENGQLQDRNRLGLRYYYTRETDGLFQFWDVNTFVNPPFGTKKGENVCNWIRKFKESADQHPKSFYVMLLPIRLESNWFQDQVWKDPLKLIYIVRGRLKFYSPTHNKNEDPHPIGSLLYIRGDDVTTEMCNDLKKNIPGFFIRGYDRI